MAVLPRYISAENVPANGPPLGGTESFLALLVVQNELRTVRSMGADGPPLKAEAGAETW